MRSPSRRPTTVSLVAATAGGGRRSRGGFTKVEALAVIVVLAAFLLWLIPAMRRNKSKAEDLWCDNHLKGVGMGFRIFRTDHGEKAPWELSVTDGGSREWLLDHPGEENEYVYRHFMAASNELGSDPETLYCARDNAPRVGDPNLGSSDVPDFDSMLGFSLEPGPRVFRRLFNLGVSYFIGVTGFPDQPQSILAGDRNLCPDGALPWSGLYTDAGIWTVPWNPNGNRRVPGFTTNTHGSKGNIAMGDGSVQMFRNNSMVAQWAFGQVEGYNPTNHNPPVQQLILPNVVGKR